MGLYDDELKAVTGGDLQDVTYWQTRFAQLKLEAALRSRQPEYAVKGLVPGVIQGAADLLRTYPEHQEVQQWKAAAEHIQSRIDPNCAPADFRGDFAHWNDYSYEAGWRSFHLARMACEAQDWSVARMHAAEAVTQFGRSQDRMTTWDPEVQAFIRDAHAEAGKMLETARAARP